MKFIFPSFHHHYCSLSNQYESPPTKNTDLSPRKHTPLGVFFMSYENLHEVAQTYVCVFNIFQTLADVIRSIMLQCTVFRCNSYVWKTFPGMKCGLAADLRLILCLRDLVLIPRPTSTKPTKLRSPLSELFSLFL